MMRDFNECLNIALDHTPVLHEKEALPLRDCLNRIAAEDVVSKLNVPAFPTSIKDGYAVRSADGIGPRRVELQVRAGDTATYRLKQGTAAYVTTGSPLPMDADAVVEQEKVLVVDTLTIAVTKPVAPGTDVRAVGSDLRHGQVVIHAGTSIGPGELGLLATIGKSHVFVCSRPRIAILASGDELIEPGSVPIDALKRGQIFDCNRPMLIAAATEMGAKIHDLGIIGDDLDTLSTRIEAAFSLNVDALITTGGVSVGDRDILRLYLERHGTILFNKVNIKPGKPMTFALLKQKSGHTLPVFSLPGNPASALVMFNAFVAPCLRKMGGWREVGPRSVFSRLLGPLPLDERPEFVRATVHTDPLNGILLSKPTGMQRSSRIASAVEADALLQLPSAKVVQGGVLPEGTLIETIIFSDWRRSDSFVKKHHEVVPPKRSPPSAPIHVDASEIAITHPHDVEAAEVAVMVIRVVEDLSSYASNETSKAGKELELLIGCSSVIYKTIPCSETLRVLKSFNEHALTHPLVIVVTSNLVAHKTSDDVVKACQVLIPGIPQFLHEQAGNLYCLVKCMAGVSQRGAVLLDLPLNPKQVTECIGLLWPLLKMAAVETFSCFQTA